MSEGNSPHICGWLKNSFIDFPGTVSTVLFFCGCNLRCPYCHNPEIVLGNGTAIPAEDVLAFIDKRKGLIDGVVLSGGEPTLYGDKLAGFAHELRTRGVRIKLDTNGLLPRVIGDVAPDYLALDIKTVPSRYGELGWKGSDPLPLLLESLRYVREMGSAAEVRITVAKGLIDDAVIDELLPLLDGIHSVFLQPCVYRGNHLDDEFTKNAVPDRSMIERCREKIAEVVKRCEVRGG